MRLFGECLEILGGSKVVLTERMGCLKDGVVVNVVVPTPGVGRFATHFGIPGLRGGHPSPRAWSRPCAAITRRWGETSR